jgi:hypothetical protein
MAYGLRGSPISTSRTGGKNPAAVGARRSGAYSAATQARTRAQVTKPAAKPAGFGAAATNFGKGAVAALRARREATGTKGGIGAAVSAYKARKTAPAGSIGIPKNEMPAKPGAGFVAGSPMAKGGFRRARKAAKKAMKAGVGKAEGYRRALTGGVARPRVDM